MTDGQEDDSSPSSDAYGAREALSSSSSNYASRAGLAASPSSNDGNDGESSSRVGLNNPKSDSESSSRAQLSYPAHAASSSASSSQAAEPSSIGLTRNPLSDSSESVVTTGLLTVGAHSCFWISLHSKHD